MASDLVKLLKLSDVGLRRAAALALRGIKTDESTKALAEIALQDDDLKVRTSAEDGLCWRSGLKDPPCNVAAEDDEPAHRAYWTRWASAVYGYEMLQGQHGLFRSITRPLGSTDP